MKEKKVVGSMSEWSGVLKDFFRQIDDGSHTLERVKAFNEHQNPFASENVLLARQKAWKRRGVKVDISHVYVPQCPGEGYRLLLIPNLSYEELFQLCKKKFSCWKWTDKSLNEVVTFSERTAKNGPYAIWVRDRQEADEELKNLSANDIKKQNITTETLHERLAHELDYFEDTGEHLDLNNWTLCAGSRCSDGGVPGVVWLGGGLYVFGYDPGRAFDYLRARLAVS